MGIEYKLADLPVEISPAEAVTNVFRSQLSWIEDRLRRGMSVILECDKELSLFVMQILRQRLGTTGVNGRFTSQMILGMVPPGSDTGGLRPSMLTLMVRQLEDLVRASEDNTIIFLPHLDLMTTTTRSNLTDMTKEVVALMYENPETVFLGFKDPSFSLPEAIRNVFPGEESLVGIPRDGITQLVNQREARKFGVETFDPFQLYKYVSGISPVRMRQIFSTITADRIDFDEQNPQALRDLYQEIRRLTLGGDLEIPRVSLDNDIAGYDSVKEKIREDILDLYRRKDELTSEEEIKKIEELIPKGVIFEGPPGTGKTFFSKAIATELDATVIIISGPELKSRWVGQSEENLRKAFQRARQNAPAIIIFDEIDSFATSRGTYTGSGVEHSMVNQLLTEMDGFRKEELVFVVATTNFAESLDPALLRPGRFELTINIPYPDDKDRKAIINLYKNKFKLDISDEMVDYIVAKTEGYSNEEHKTKFSGDHLYAICRGLCREVIRSDSTTVTRKQVDKVVKTGFSIRPPTENERNTIAIHEVGHALVAILADQARAPDKISLQGLGDYVSAYVKQEEWAGDHVRTEQELLDQICVCLGGRAAEMIFLKTASSGAAADLVDANRIARVMVEKLGMSGDDNYLLVSTKNASPSQQAAVDERVADILKSQMIRAKGIIKKNSDLHEAIMAKLLEKDVLSKEDLKNICQEAGRDIEKLSWEKGYTVDAD